MLRKTFETSAFVALILVAWVWVIGWASDAFGQVAGQPGPATGTGYPANSNPIAVAFNGNVGTTPATLSIPAVQGRFSYICGISALNNGATAANAAGVLTIAGLTGSTTFTFSFPYGAAATVTVFSGTTGTPVVFTPCIPGSAVNTAITATVAVEAGNTNTFINMWGYQLAQ